VGDPVDRVGGEVWGCHVDGTRPKRLARPERRNKQWRWDATTAIPLGGRAIHSATASRPELAPDRTAPPRRWLQPTNKTYEGPNPRGHRRREQAQTWTTSTATRTATTQATGETG